MMSFDFGSNSFHKQCKTATGGLSSMALKRHAIPGFLTLEWEMVRLSTGCPVSNSWISSMTWASEPRINTLCSQPSAAAQGGRGGGGWGFSSLHICCVQSNFQFKFTFKCNGLSPSLQGNSFRACIKTYIFKLIAPNPTTNNMQKNTFDSQAANLNSINMILETIHTHTPVIAN